MTQDSPPPEYILYIQGSDINGLKALRYVQHFPNMFLVRDVGDLAKIPEWLIGTPSLLSLKTNKLYRGTHALQKLIAIKNKMTDPDSALPPPPKVATPLPPQKAQKVADEAPKEQPVKEVIKETPPKSDEKKKDTIYDPLPKANVSQEKLKSQAEEIFTPFPKPDKDSNNPNPPQIVATPLPGSAFRESKTVDPAAPPKPAGQQDKTQTPAISPLISEASTTTS
jgi:hypothetical protein